MMYQNAYADTHTGAVCKRANENTQCKQALSPVKSVERESACYENADMYSASTYRTEERRTQAPESGWILLIISPQGSDCKTRNLNFWKKA